MRVVYDPSHVLHDPETEVQTGVAMPMYEVPARAESIRAALLADDQFSFADPTGHGLEPVTAVHHDDAVPDAEDDALYDARKAYEDAIEHFGDDDAFASHAAATTDIAQALGRSYQAVRTTLACTSASATAT